MLKEKLRRQRNGTITIYLTLQPCNNSTTLNPRGTKLTPPEKTCCETLKKIFKEILRYKNISLCLKVTHTNSLGPEPANDVQSIELRERAEKGIRKLKTRGVTVESMTQQDWEYLFGLTEFTSDNAPSQNDSRKDLDNTIEIILGSLEPFSDDIGAFDASGFVECLCT